jgi:cell division septum initiation protein DivIVA
LSKLKQRRNMSVAPWFLDTSSPDEVARANFPIVRRGFDPVEVQAFARAVGTEIARLQALNSEYGERMSEAESRANARVDETTVAQFLGEESSRLLLVARDTANEVRARAEDYANVTVRGADTYAKNKTSEADAYHNKVTHEADAEAAKTRREAREDGERVRLEARREADRLIAETMAHRAQLLKDLTERRDLGLAQLRDLLAGRDVLVEAIEQVRMTASGLTSNLQEIVTAPASFVSLDPAIEGPGDVLDEGASAAVSRERRPVKARRTRPPTAAEGAATGPDTANGDATPAVRTATPAPRTTAAPATTTAAAPAAGAAPAADAHDTETADPITTEIPIITADAVAAPSPA